MHNVCLKNKTMVLLPNVCGRGRGGEMETGIDKRREAGRRVI